MLVRLKCDWFLCYSSTRQAYKSDRRMIISELKKICIDLLSVLFVVVKYRSSAVSRVRRHSRPCDSRTRCNAFLQPLLLHKYHKLHIERPRKRPATRLCEQQKVSYDGNRQTETLAASMLYYLPATCSGSLKVCLLVLFLDK